jgi:TonB family protein
MNAFFQTSILILFILGNEKKISAQNQIDTSKCEFKENAFFFVEKMPTFPGGDKAMITYVRENLIYPESAKKAKQEGTVVVQFIIDSIGNTICSKVNRGISKDCDQEALRIVDNFPKWLPGMHNGKAVNVQFTLPIRFKLP